MVPMRSSASAYDPRAARLRATPNPNGRLGGCAGTMVWRPLEAYGPTAQLTQLVRSYED